jgi:hypothetical protein
MTPEQTLLLACRESMVVASALKYQVDWGYLIGTIDAMLEGPAPSILGVWRIGGVAHHGSLDLFCGDTFVARVAPSGAMFETARRIVDAMNEPQRDLKP